MKQKTATSPGKAPSVALKRLVTPVNRYVLDLRKCKDLPPVFDGIKELPLVDGRHDSEYDLDEAALPPEVVKRLRKYAHSLYPGRRGGKKMPIGFNNIRKPARAVLRKV